MVNVKEVTMMRAKCGHTGRLAGGRQGAVVLGFARGARDRIRRTRAGGWLIDAAYELVVPAVRSANAAMRRLAARSHWLQYKVEGLLRPDAHWFDHELDVHWQWEAQQRSTFLERGVLNTLAMRKGARVLDLCCGDGFHT